MALHRTVFRRAPRARAVALVLMFAVAACSADDPERTQPAPNATTFEVGRFDDLPQPPRSKPLGARTATGGVVTRSYRVVGTSAEQVLEFYVDALPAWGWVLSRPVERLGTGTYRGTWTADGHELTISSSAAPTLGDGDAAAEVESQYSLNLRLGTG